MKINNERYNLHNLSLVRERIEGANNILIVSHKNPDSDGIGSMCAMMLWLKSIGCAYKAFSYDGVPQSLEYLKNSHEILSHLDEIKNENFNLVLALDCADQNYSGIGEFLESINDNGTEIVNIDHHPKSQYGDVNINNHTASSTAEILYDLFTAWKVVINKDMATALLAGILYDTNSFLNSNTEIKTLETAARLYELGARYSFISRQMYQNKNMRGLKIWSKVLSRLQKNDKLKVVFSLILEDDIENRDESATEGLANFFNYLEGLKIVMIFKETAGGEIKVSLRSLEEGIDVSKFAGLFGGGGHKKAAGFSVKGTLERVNNYWQII